MQLPVFNFSAFVTTILQNTGVEPWIGLQQHYDKSYYWIDNTEVKFTNWDKGQPNSYGGVCIGQGVDCMRHILWLYKVHK